MTDIEARYRVEARARASDAWMAITWSDGVPLTLPLDNARSEAAHRRQIGRSNPNWPRFQTRIVRDSADAQAARQQRRQTVITRAIHLAREAGEALDAGNYADAIGLLREARACAVVLDAPLASDVIDTFVSTHNLH